MLFLRPWAPFPCTRQVAIHGVVAKSSVIRSIPWPKGRGIMCGSTWLTNARWVFVHSSLSNAMSCQGCSLVSSRGLWGVSSPRLFPRRPACDHVQGESFQGLAPPSTSPCGNDRHPTVWRSVGQTRGAPRPAPPCGNHCRTRADLHTSSDHYAVRLANCVKSSPAFGHLSRFSGSCGLVPLRPRATLLGSNVLSPSTMRDMGIQEGVALAVSPSTTPWHATSASCDGSIPMRLVSPA